LNAALERFGWNTEWEERFAPLHADGLEPGRVVVQQRGLLTVATAAGERGAEVGGRLHRDAGPGGLPVAGDWVALRGGRIEAVVERRTSFVRRAPDQETLAQVVAANVDVALVVAALPDAVNLRRLERYVTTAWDSGATPVVVLTKVDLAADPAEELLAAESAAPGVDVIATSAVSGEGLDELRAALVPSRTGALLGVSGAGKSSLLNRLLGEERVATAEIRADGRGRHTTTHRELVPLPGGGIVLDTPGMRELGLWADDTSLDATFDDVSSLAAGCRFGDCAHETEPGCAVLAAVEDGSLAPERLAAYRKLGRELAHLERRNDPRLQAEQRRHWKKINVEYRRATRNR
jgi:ribosome biogenesis GTPase